MKSENSSGYAVQYMHSLKIRGCDKRGDQQI